MNKNLIAVAALSTVLVVACKTVPKLSGYAEKTNLEKQARYDVSTSTIRDNGRGFTVDFKKLPHAPKRIALVSFYVEDPGITKTSGTRSTGKSYSTTNSSQEVVEAYASYFCKISVDNMGKTFSANGMKVLTPAEFLTDEDKKNYYKSFTAKHSKLNAVGAKITKYFKNSLTAGTSIESRGVASGFTLCDMNTNIPMANAKKMAVKANGGVGPMDNELIESMGYDLCKKLDVDAVLVVVNTQLADSKHRQARHWLSAVSMYMFGPNPLPLAEGKKDNMFYSKGLFYSGYRMAFKKGLCIDPRIKDEAKKTANDKLNEKAYNNMITAMAAKMCNDVNQKG